MLWLKGMIGLYTFRSSLKNLLCTDHRPTRWGGILIGWVPIVYGQRSALTSIDARHRRYGVKDAASSDRHPIYDRTSYASQPCWLFSLQQLNRKSLGISIIMLGVLLFFLNRQEYKTALMPLFFPPWTRTVCLAALATSRYFHPMHSCQYLRFIHNCNNTSDWSLSD